MSFPRPSRNLLAGLILLILVVTAQLLPREEAASHFSEQFPEVREIEFSNSSGDLAESHRNKGLIDFNGQRHNALLGDDNSLIEIFTTYRAEPEAYLR
jgi:hypothetical protein